MVVNKLHALARVGESSFAKQRQALLDTTLAIFVTTRVVDAEEKA